MKELALSVVIITYNQVKYVRQCIESVIQQNINYTYEILIGDDCSTDGTAEIVKGFGDKYPGLVKCILRDKNVGASRNIYDLLMMSKGRYITRLEGDDYFEKTDQIGKSIRFLDKHPEYIAVAHNVKNLNEQTGELKNSPKLYNRDHRITVDDYKKGIHMGDHIYRNFFRDSTEDFSIIYAADPMLFEEPLSFLEISRGNVYVTQAAWEVKRCNRVSDASNYNSITGQYKHFENSCKLYDRMSEYAPDFDFSYMRSNCAVDTIFNAVSDKDFKMVIYVYSKIPFKTKIFTTEGVIEQGIKKILRLIKEDKRNASC